MVRPEAWEGVAGIVGRESELKVLGEFVAAAAGGGALVLKGGPGVGKTTLWEAGRDAALDLGMRVLSARPNSAETSLSFVSLADLLNGIVLSDLPAPQRRGLEVALLRADPAGEAAAPRAIAFGLLNLLRQLAVDRPLLVTVDDLRVSESLTFSARQAQAATPSRRTDCQRLSSAHRRQLLDTGAKPDPGELTCISRWKRHPALPPPRREHAGCCPG